MVNQPGWWFQSLWKILVSWDDDIPNIWKVIKAMLQTTNQQLWLYGLWVMFNSYVTHYQRLTFIPRENTFRSSHCWAHVAWCWNHPSPRCSHSEEKRENLRVDSQFTIVYHSLPRFLSFDFCWGLLLAVNCRKLDLLEGSKWVRCSFRVEFY